MRCCLLQAVVETFPYKAVMTFGGCGTDFMLVVMVKSSVVHTRRLLFTMSKQKVFTVTAYSSQTLSNENVLRVKLKYCKL